MSFIQVLIPIFLIFTIGYIGQRTIGFETKNLSKMALYLLSPFLVFRTFYTTEFNWNHLYIIVYSLLLCIILIVLAYGISFLRKYSVSKTCALILTTAFSNNGNYGTPVALLLFGAIGFDIAIIIMVIQQILMCTVGLYYAAKGSPNNVGATSALKEVVKMPIIYGALAGGGFQFLQISISEAVMSSVHLVANSAIPVIMVILGMQLAKIPLRPGKIGDLSISLGIKLIAAPFVAYGLTFILPVDEIVKQLMIIMAAMPAASNTTMYALQFETEPEFISSATLFSTLFTIVTLPILFLIVV